MADWFGSTWAVIGWVIVSTVAVYVSTLVVLRIAGRRTIADLSAFDFVATVAVGTIVSSTAVSADPSYVEGMTALVTILMLQVGLASLRLRVPLLRDLVDFKPEVVVRDGELTLPRGPLTSQLTEEELHARLRERRVYDVSKAQLVILEADGKLSVVMRDDDAEGPLGDPSMTEGS